MPPDMRAIALFAAALVLCMACGTSPAAQRANPSAAPSTSAGPPTPYEDAGACPFEGCTYRAWRANAAVPIRSDRRKTAKVAFTVAPREWVTALTGIVVTVKAGRAEFREPTTMTSASGTIQIAPGQTLYLLTYQGEGYTKAWFNGRLYVSVDTASFFNGVCTFSPGRCTGTIVEKSLTEWWVKIRSRSGKIGWTDQPEKFDNKDMYGGPLPD